MDIKSYIRVFADFPESGVNFKDISPILRSSEAMIYIIKQFEQQFKDTQYDLIAGAESRGLMFAIAFAIHVQKGCIMIRKKGKLPGQTVEMPYDLEYGEGILEIQRDAIKPGQRVLVIDDLLATGGTAQGSAKLIEKVGGKVAGFGFVIELAFLKGIELIKDYNTKILVSYEQ